MSQEQPKYTGKDSVVDQETGDMVTPEELAKRKEERKREREFGPEQK